MRNVWFVGALLALSACSEGDRSYLLTYERPKATSAIAQNAPPQTAVVAAPAERPPAPAPTHPASLAPEPVESSSPAENLTPAPRSTVRAEPSEPSAPSHVATVTPSPPAAAQLKPAPAPVANPSIPAESPPPIEQSVVPASPAPPPQVIVLKPRSGNEMIAPRSTSENRGGIPAMVRPAPPPTETAPPPLTLPAAVQATAEAAAMAAGAVASAAPAPGAGPAPTYSERDAARCKAVADQRALDAVANGYDDDMEQQIFAGTYRSCMAWAAQHR